MSKTASKEELLEVCIQDLHAGRADAVDRLECIAREAGAKVAPAVAELARAFAAEAGRFEKLGIDLDGPSNLWMAGIMDDAERDTRSIEAGVLLDIAIVGAVRKAIAADAASLETALALAVALSKPDVAETVQAMLDRRREADDALRAALEALA